MALGGFRRKDLCPIQATVPPLCQEARGQQVWVESEVKVQTVAAMPQLVEDSIEVRLAL